MWFYVSNNSEEFIVLNNKAGYLASTHLDYKYLVI